jgi:hypothetical protein
MRVRQPHPIDPRVAARRNAAAARLLASRRSGSAVRVSQGRPTPRAGATTRTRLRRMADWCASVTTTAERLQHMANVCAVETMRRARFWGIRS